MTGAVLVTGAASGIGRALCEQLVALGRDVVGLDRAEVELPGVRPLACDLLDEAALPPVAEAVDGPLGGIAHVAGLPGTHPAADVLAVNLLAVDLLTRTLAPRLAPGAGVVAVGSISAHSAAASQDDLAALLAARDYAAGRAWAAAHGLDGPEAYVTSKRALELWVEDACDALLPLGVRAAVVSPGPVRTPILEDFVASMGAARIAAASEVVGRHAEPAEVAAVLAFLLSDAARWVNGVVVRVDGGLHAARAARAREAVAPQTAP